MSERASNLPVSEQYRLAAKDWVDKDAAARLLEETKTAVLAQRMKALGDMPATHAEREVKASEEWFDYLRKMVDAKRTANLAKVRLEYVRMKFMEERASEATRRAEMRM